MPRDDSRDRTGNQKPDGHWQDADIEADQREDAEEPAVRRRCRHGNGDLVLERRAGRSQHADDVGIPSTHGYGNGQRRAAEVS